MTSVKLLSWIHLATDNSKMALKLVAHAFHSYKKPESIKIHHPGSGVHTYELKARIDDQSPDNRFTSQRQ